jgi:hypothetical protein
MLPSIFQFRNVREESLSGLVPIVCAHYRWRSFARGLVSFARGLVDALVEVIADLRDFIGVHTSHPPNACAAAWNKPDLRAVG